MKSGNRSRVSKNAVLVASTVAFFSCPAWASDDSSKVSTTFQKYSAQGEDAFSKGQYKRAEALMGKALNAIAESGEKDESLARALKRFGEILTKEEKYPDAERAFRQAAELNQTLGVTDNELSNDMTQLSQSYRTVDTSKLGDFAAQSLKEANISSMAIYKTDGGSQVRIALPARFSKKIDNPDVDEVGFDRLVSFDVSEQPDGTVRINNIKGFRVHAKIWVSIVDSLFKRGQNGERTADITAQKLGISKTVSTKLPDDAFQPIDGLLQQIHATASAGSPSVASGASSPETGGAGLSSPTAVDAGAVSGSSSSASGTGTGADNTSTSTAPTSGTETSSASSGAAGVNSGAEPSNAPVAGSNSNGNDISSPTPTAN